MIVGILGFAGTGKDTVADILIENGFQKIGFADRLKRVCMEIFGFDAGQMWGSIARKEDKDLRFPREHTWNQDKRAHESTCLCCGAHFDDPDRDPCFLTPRYAMKIVGTEGARHCWADIWVKRALEDVVRIHAGEWYNQARGFDVKHHLDEAGIDPDSARRGPRNAVFTDNRFVNEVEAIQKAGGAVYRIKRAGFEKPMFDHPSETEQLQIPDDRLQGVIHNDGTLDDLRKTVLATVRHNW